jgi:integrase/recombinase XerD
MAKKILVRREASGPLKATRAKSDKALLESWIASLPAKTTQEKFRVTAERFLAALAPIGLREATVEDVREARDHIGRNAAGEELSQATRRQYELRIKSLLSYAHKLGYTLFNAGVTLKVKPDQSRAQLAKRIIEPVEVQQLIRAARRPRDRLLMAVLYAGGLRISELVGLSWSDIIQREDKVQLSVLGKGGRVRQVLLPTAVSKALLELRGDTGAGEAVFATRTGTRLKQRAIRYMIKRAARKAGVPETISPHWLRHAHGSHALERGATLAEVQSTLGHANVSTTSGYLHARPNSSSGLALDEGIFR